MGREREACRGGPLISGAAQGVGGFGAVCMAGTAGCTVDQSCRPEQTQWLVEFGTVDG